MAMQHSLNWFGITRLGVIRHQRQPPVCRGVGYGKWLRIDGFSEAVIDYIQRYEASLEVN